jgi:hypothetical protein
MVFELLGVLESLEPEASTPLYSRSTKNAIRLCDFVGLIGLDSAPSWDASQTQRAGRVVPILAYRDEA